ncbi:MAG: hypothetical protein M3273_06775, partial [Actinomycetota bacterium]|nr:hypothetical protein [Actinomycetota bacterium]
MTFSLARTFRAAVAAAAAALVAVGVVHPASAADLEELRARAQALGDEVSGLEHRLETLSQRESELTGEIEDLSAEIGALELELRDNEAAIEVARDRFVERAIEAYKGSRTGTLALLLSARDVTELLTLAQAATSAAEADADALEDLLDAQESVETAQARVDQRK